MQGSNKSASHMSFSGHGLPHLMASDKMHASISLSSNKSVSPNNRDAVVSVDRTDRERPQKREIRKEKRRKPARHKALKRTHYRRPDSSRPSWDLIISASIMHQRSFHVPSGIGACNSNTSGDEENMHIHLAFKISTGRTEERQAHVIRHIVRGKRQRAPP